MKKNILILLSVLSSFCWLTIGCSEQENEGPGYDGDEIRIATNILAVTRGGGVINPSHNGLEVGFVRLDEGKNYATGRKLTGSVSTTDILTFTPSPEYYPSNGSGVRLIGWYPNTGEFSGSSSSESATVKFDIDGSTDIMVTDLVSGSGSNPVRGITFNHVLSQVVVQAYYENSGTKEALGSISSVTIVDKSQECVLTLPDPNTDDKDADISFGVEKEDLLLELITPLDIGIGSSNPTTCGYVMFAPTPTQDISEELNMVVTTEKAGPLYAKISYKFEAGKKYEITLKFNALGATIGIEEWEDNGVYPSPVDAIDTDFHIEGYENKIIVVTLVDEVAVEKVVLLRLNSSGEGSIAIGNCVVKSIQAVDGLDFPKILIGRKKSETEKVEINLTVDAANHEVQWRPEAEDVTTVVISTVAEMQRLSINFAPTLYKLVEDLDLKNQEWVPIVTLPSGKTLDGGHHNIHNLKITSPSTTGFWGLFAMCDGSTIKDLHIASGEINVTGAGGSTSAFVGTFAGLMSGDSHIIGCSNRATVLSKSCAGICGSLDGGTIVACVNYANITSEGAGTGGICYYQQAGTIEACYNTGTITSTTSGTYYCAGITGRFSKGTITSCYNTGRIVKQGNSTNTAIGAINGSFSSGASPTINCFYSADSYTSAGTSNTSSKVFSADEGGWPSESLTNWGIGDGTTSGYYWKSLGGWNGGSPQYPELYWE
ncbi:hypothetical protein EZS27_003929 [termite gut metagenome]|uniref:GLUG domain-containing protein n=1 Tax=termite gut metagenome TaxID=433724 RepID=A0A5J4STK7_9ZZZZ